MAMSYGRSTQLNSAESSLNSMLSFVMVKFHGLQQQQQIATSSSSGSGPSGRKNSVGNVSTMKASSSSNLVLEFTSAVHALLNSTVLASPAAGNRGQIQNGSQNQQRWAVGDAREAVLWVLEDGLGLDVRHPSPVTRDLPLVKDPVPVVVCILLYVAGTWLWKSHIRKSGMKPRREDPLPLRCVVVVHNLFLCCLSAFMAYGLLASAHRLRYSMWGNLYRGDEIEMGMYIYFFCVKAIRVHGHGYHAISTEPSTIYFSAAFNSCIHVVMYFYYLLAATVAKDESKRRKYLFWGKYLTMLQMAQFVSFIMQSVYAMWRPALYSRGIPRLLFFYSPSLLACFGNFFVKKYNVRRRPQPALQQTSEKKVL